MSIVGETDAPTGSWTPPQATRHSNTTINRNAKDDHQLLFPAGMKDTFGIKSLCQENCIQVGVVVESLPHCSLEKVKKKHRVT